MCSSTRRVRSSGPNVIVSARAPRPASVEPFSDESSLKPEWCAPKTALASMALTVTSIDSGSVSSRRITNSTTCSNFRTSICVWPKETCATLSSAMLSSSCAADTLTACTLVSRFFRARSLWRLEIRYSSPKQSMPKVVVPLDEPLQASFTPASKSPQRRTLGSTQKTQKKHKPQTMSHARH